MLTYLHAIQIGVLLFFVFFLLSLIPYMIVQYRKYGRVNPWRFIVNFSFVLYIVCAYAMTILFATLSRTRKLWYERLSQTELSAKEI